MIPKVLFQTSKIKPKKYIVEKIKGKIGDSWKYEHYNDEEIIEFMKANYIEEFKDIINVFKKIKRGAHKADLFRYYYIYINGGVFMDSDAMLQVNIEEITKDYNFFSVNSKCTPNSIFQGFIGAIPKHNIIYKALVDVYKINIDDLSRSYFLLVKNLYRIIEVERKGKKEDKDGIKLYEEDFIDNNKAKCYNEKNSILLIHYFKYKIIPE